MPRFTGTLVEDGAKKPRFGGTHVQGGKHLSFEEGQKLLEQERLSGVEGEVGAGLSSFVDGVPVVGPYVLGGAQRAAAGISSLIDGEDYGTNLKQAQEVTKTAQEQNPVVSTVGQVAGGVAGTVPLVAAAPGAFGIGAASLPARILAGGASGLTIGGTDAAVRSDGDLGKTAIGAGTGLVLGGAGPFVADKAGAIYRALANGSAQKAAATAAGTNRDAVDVVARAMASDNASNATNSSIAAAGSRAMLADSGPSTLSVLDAAIQRGGPQAGEAAQRINARAAGATGDINAALDTGLGTPQGMVRPLDEIRTNSAPARSNAYDAAYATPIDYADPRGQSLEALIKGRVPSSILDRANRMMRVEGAESQQIHANIGTDGGISFETLPDVRQIDYITRALNDVAKAGDGAGALGGNTAEGRAYGNLARELRRNLGDLVPDYQNALNTAAEPIAQREAMMMGQKLLSPSMARDEVEDAVAGMTNAELQHLRTGIRSNFDEKLANITRTVADPNIDARQGVAALKDLSSEAARQKLATVMGQAEADRMLAAVDEASHSFNLRAGVATNSRTYARQAAERAVDEKTGPGVVDSVASGKPIASAQRMVQALLGADPQAQLARKDVAWGEIANLLTQPASQGGGTVLQALQRAANQIPVTDQKTEAIVRALTRGGAVSSIPTGRLLREGR
jgi:hypothetical protein